MEKQQTRFMLIPSAEHNRPLSTPHPTLPRNVHRSGEELDAADTPTFSKFTQSCQTAGERAREKREI